MKYKQSVELEEHTKGMPVTAKDVGELVHSVGVIDVPNDEVGVVVERGFVKKLSFVTIW